jgi:hypothetical protein
MPRSCKLPAMPGSGRMACRSRPGRNTWASRSRLPSPMRASGEDPARVREMLTLALSVFTRP